MARPANGITAAMRFWSKVRKTRGCWLWTGLTVKPARANNLEYGTFKIGSKATMVHRFSFVLHGGKLKPGELVLHECDTPLCVKPSHLFSGTQADNVKDCVQKDRHSRGGRNKVAKLTDKDVKTIRAEYVPYHRKHGTRAIARRYGITPGVIGDVVKRKRWKHVK